MYSGGMDFMSILILISVAAGAFYLYVAFKMLEFILTATNLYKEMVKKQAGMLSLLADIRDNTKDFDKTTAN